MKDRTIMLITVAVFVTTMVIVAAVMSFAVR